jgi:quinol monooxygenase YgiN
MEELQMWGMIAKITTIEGKREEMISVLRESASGMPGCLSYVVAKDSIDQNILWVNEVWDNQASHDASLSLPQVQNAITRAKTLVAYFERIAALEPVWGAGLASPCAGTVR